MENGWILAKDFNLILFLAYIGLVQLDLLCANFYAISYYYHCCLRCGYWIHLESDLNLVLSNFGPRLPSGLNRFENSLVIFFMYLRLILILDAILVPF